MLPTQLNAIFVLNEINGAGVSERSLPSAESLSNLSDLFEVPEPHTKITNSKHRCVQRSKMLQSARTTDRFEYR